MRANPLRTALLLGLLLTGGTVLWLAPATEPAAVAVHTPAAPTVQGFASGPAVPHHTAVLMPEHLLAGPGYQDVVQRIRARRAGAQLLFPNDKAFAQAREQEVLFSVSSHPQAARQSALANERRRQDGRDWIAYDMRVLAARAEGDRFLLPLPGAAAVHAEIDAVDIAQGQYRWSGRIIGQPGGTFHITQVFEDEYAIGTINTPAGEYLLEVKAGTGWVTDSGREFFLPPDGKDTTSDHHAHEGTPAKTRSP